MNTQDSDPRMTKVTPMKGECAVCGASVPSGLPPRKDPKTPRFCDDHDGDDLVKISRQEHHERQVEQIQQRYERY